MRVTLNDLIIPKYDDLLFDILDHKHTHYTLYGGRGSCKSSFVAIAIILLIIEHKDVNAVVFRKIAGTLRDSVYANLCFAISLLGLDEAFKRTISPMEITYKKTGQKILFRGVDQPEKIKSIKAANGYFGVTWFEELDQYHGRDEIRNVLQSTMRGKGGIFWNFESFNPPISRSNWANTDLDIDRPERRTIKSSYLDVPREWLSEQFFNEADFLKEINPRAYRHEYLGEAVGTGGNVFENVNIRTITEDEVSSFDRIYCGLDWGYFPDPLAFIVCYYHAGQRKLYMFDEEQRYKMGNNELAQLIVRWKHEKITADSAEPKSINDMVKLGYRVKGAVKGAGSVEHGMKWLASLGEIVIDKKRCPHAAREFLAYEYQRTKDGELVSGYPDKDNHFIDATRYALENIMRNSIAKVANKRDLGVM